MPGRWCAFVAVAACVLVLRRRSPEARRPFRTPFAWVVAPAAILGCCYLFMSLQHVTQVSFLVWNGIGLLVYFLYARSRAVMGMQ
jgi:APA family basic amino acid/polyamine antiporter